MAASLFSKICFRYTPTASDILHVPRADPDNDSGDSNFLDLEWLSTSGNSSDERSTFHFFLL
jgi:phosphatidylinositol 3,5-bisphosphate 5-phosphatase